MLVGREHISAVQTQNLEYARSEGPTWRVARYLMRLMRDPDILDGSEEVHPTWLDIFEERQEKFAEILPDRVFRQLSEFFGSLVPIGPAVAEMNPEELRISFLLGAGASKPEPSNIPTVKELLPHLLERARRLDREDVTKLADFCEMRGIVNIEDLLTAAELATFSSRSPTVLSLVNFLLYGGETEEPYHRPGRHETLADLASVAFLQDTLQVLFGLLSSTMLPAKPNAAHKAIAEYAKRRERTSIITTNYDCCMDLALEEHGQHFVYEVEFSNPDEHALEAKTAAILIKLHGSLNWFYCQTCQKVRRVNITEMVENFTTDMFPFPVISICRDCGGQRRGLVVPPLALKFDVPPPLTRAMMHAANAFQESDLVLVVGFSFAEADIYISRMLSKSMQISHKQKMLIVDPDSGIVERVRRKFMARIPGFEPSRIIKICGDCADMLPKFLHGELFQGTKKAAAAEGSATRTTAQSD